MVGVQHILIRVAQRKLVCNWGPPAPVWRSPVVRRVCRYRLKEFSLCLWCSACSLNQLSPLHLLICHSPSTRRLFSGSRFPLEMLSSMGFHISSLSVSLLPGRSWLPGVRVGKLGVRRALAILRRCCGGASTRGVRRFLVGTTGLSD
jgi:hypothetical protein